MTNLFKELFKGSSKRCCNIKIEEVKKEEQNKEIPIQIKQTIIIPAAKQE